MTKKITKKQRQILEFIEAYGAENDTSPSYREIASALGLSSVASVAEHINNLIEKGCLKKTDGEARSLEILDYRHLETVNLFRERLISATAEESQILLSAMKLLDLELPEK